MMRVVVVMWFLTGCAVSRSQVPVGVEDFFLDPMGKAYFLLEDARLVTGNQLGGNTYSFYDSSLGGPDYVDVANPFQILLYYRDYGMVLILDRTLSELDRIDLFANPAIRQPGALARSYDNGIWVFDNWSYRLLRLDERGEVDRQTNNLRLELNGPGAPDALYVDRNAVMLYFREENRMAVFTNYGEFQRWVTVPPATDLSWNPPYLLGIAGGRSWRWTSGGTTVTDLGPLPEELAAERRVLAGPDGFLSVEPGRFLLRKTVFE